MGRGSRTEGVGSLLVNSVSIGRIEVIGRNRKCAEKVDREFSRFCFFFSFFSPSPFLPRFSPVPRYARRDASCTTRKLVIYVSGRKLAIEGTATCYRHCGERREKVRVTSICLVRETVIYCFFFSSGILRVYPASNKREAKVRSSSIIRTREKITSTCIYPS